ncbi:MAG: alkaline phosphatase family protein [Alphaproteobacteria bacterium]|nr:alkaline phosphatase family protein [Alphaproteobacteria bacterium]
MKKLLLAALLFAVPALAQTPAKPPNIIIFVADGLRYGSVTAENTPNMWRLKTQGVDFTNSHSLFPTVTTVNASAIATGHYIGDTGNFGNSLWVGASLTNGSAIAGLENNNVLAEMNARFGGNYLNETSLLAAARAKGWQTAIVGKLGPSRIQDLTAKSDGSETLILDDSLARETGFGQPTWFTQKLQAKHTEAAIPVTSMPNIAQQTNQMKAVTRIVLPHFAESGKPFALLYWSRDPDLTQHSARDSLGEYDPGINGPSGLAAVRNADTMLGLLLQALKDQGLDRTTDIFVTADHGFVTNARESATSPSARDDQLGNGFLANDLAAGLKLKLSGSNLGDDPAHPDVIVVPNGGAALLYLPGANAAKLAGDAVNFLSGQDYVSGLFVNDRLGTVAGALPMSAINLIGSAATPQPDIIVNFRTFQGPCGTLQCVRGVYGGMIGQGSHGSFSRAETRNFMAAIGPDFKSGFADPAPISNADIAPTLARIGGIDLAPKGKLTGRVISEALVGGAPVRVTRGTQASDPTPNGSRTIMNFQAVGANRYFDAAGFAGKTVGLVP